MISITDFCLAFNDVKIVIYSSIIFDIFLRYLQIKEVYDLYYLLNDFIFVIIQLI